jgi:hypothetical protein
LPQLVKGGKHAYGWSEVSITEKNAIPDEALKEYNLVATCKLFLLSSSKRSGGFALTTMSLLKNSVLSNLLDENSKMTSYQLSEGQTITVAGKPYCWVRLNTDGSIIVPLKTLEKYGVKAGDQLLSVRGSCFALAFCVEGPRIKEAKNHQNLTLFT